MSAATEEDIQLSAKDGAFEKCTVWVGSVPKGNCTPECLKEFFSTYGKVINVKW